MMAGHGHTTSSSSVNTSTSGGSSTSTSSSNVLYSYNASTTTTTTTVPPPLTHVVQSMQSQPMQSSASASASTSSASTSSASTSYNDYVGGSGRSGHDHAHYHLSPSPASSGAASASASPSPSASASANADALLFSDDEEKDDPNQVEEIISNELFDLSFKERNDNQEEIHGVRCLAQDETPLLIQESLELLGIVLLNNELYSNYTSSYNTEILINKSLNPPTTKYNNMNTNSYNSSYTDNSSYTGNNSSYTDNNSNSNNTNSSPSSSSSSYINTKQFRLRFLRCELFDIKKAAIRMIKWLDLVVELFGTYALERPIRFSDFNRKELKDFYKGRYQFLPYRDRGIGRRILLIFPDEHWENIAPYLRSKILMYILFTAGYDIDTQRKGVVIVIWFDATFKISAQPKLHCKDHNLTTVRVSAMHQCSPDTPLFRFRRAVTTMRIAHIRSRMKIHVGSPIEIQYILQGYGIPIETIPITYTGKIKNVYLSQWLRLRRLLESSKNRNELLGISTRTTLSSSSTNKKSKAKSKSKANKSTTLLPVDTSISSNSSSSSSDSGNDVINDDSHSYGNGCTGKKRNRTFIECPYLNDVLFRQGSPLLSNAGNRTLRSMIQEKTIQHGRYYLDQQNNNKRSSDSSSGSAITANIVTSMGSSFSETSNNININSISSSKVKKPPKLTVIAEQIVKELRYITNNEIRFLIWNNEGWWDEITDEKDILLKVYMLVREYRKNFVNGGKPKAKTTAAAAATTTTGTTNKDNANAKLTAASAASTPITLRPEGVMMQHQYLEQQQQQQQQKVISGTTMFQSMDGGSAPRLESFAKCCLPSSDNNNNNNNNNINSSNKKQKLISNNNDDRTSIVPPSFLFSTTTTTTTTTSTHHHNIYNIDYDSDNDNGYDINYDNDNNSNNNNSCFGMKFTW